MTMYSIGHSVRTMNEFSSLLKKNKIVNLVDIRRFPYSPRNPQYNIDNLKSTLPELNINYYHLESLAGRRNPEPDSINDGFRNKGFRGYADYMSTAEFREGIKILTGIANSGNTAFMCAEAVPWRCHRSLLSDFLTVNGVEVLEIISESSVRLHKLNSLAIWDGEELRYPKSNQTKLS